MGVIDTEGKQYLSTNSIFADLFNFLLHDGRPIIKAEELKSWIQRKLPYRMGMGRECPSRNIETF